ncbi:hypothetical protein QYF36_020697 [Acer negundo]|nr:hypothetical protein QYF36_020697 [Acer negundo]
MARNSVAHTLASVAFSSGYEVVFQPVLFLCLFSIVLFVSCFVIPVARNSVSHTLASLAFFSDCETVASTVSVDGPCCKEHPKFGQCDPNNPGNENNKRCKAFCMQNCKGAICKKVYGKGHLCHCLC